MYAYENSHTREHAADQKYACPTWCLLRGSGIILLIQKVGHALLLLLLLLQREIIELRMGGETDKHANLLKQGHGAWQEDFLPERLNNSNIAPHVLENQTQISFNNPESHYSHHSNRNLRRRRKVRSHTSSTISSAMFAVINAETATQLRMIIMILPGGALFPRLSAKHQLL